MKMDVRFGPAGFGMEAKKALFKLKALGLNAVEIEFVYKVWMSNEEAKEIGDLAKKLDIMLSVHAPYYINLASKEKKKIELSKKRILESCEKASYLKARYVVFHPAYYGRLSKEKCYEIVKEAVEEMQEKIRNEGWKVKLALETTGRKSQFGTLDEILRLVKETKCFFCVDFAHIKARNNGTINYDEVFKKIRKFDHIHAHFSSIEYTEKGEKKHLPTKESELLELLTFIKKYNVSLTLINESPIAWKDSLKARKMWEKINER